MIEKIEPQSNVAVLEIAGASDTPHKTPDLPAMIEEERVRDALSMAKDVLADLSESIIHDTQANSPDADRGQGRMSAEVFDLVSS